MGRRRQPYGRRKFVFVPDPNNRLTFTWTDSSGSKRSIQPEMMYTDGGSIPRLARIFKGFGPWGYTPVYMIHDWLYVARHCNVDGTLTPAEAEVAAISFQDSAVILAASIKALVNAGRVQQDDVAASTISDSLPGQRGAWFMGF